MGHFVFELARGGYVGTRKNNGQLYESRPTAAAMLEEARIFNTKAAASRAGNALGKPGQARAVRLVLD